jgi:hypothetical protein
LEKIDPKGITASGVYGSFSGAIEDTEVNFIQNSYFRIVMKLCKLAIKYIMGRNGTMKLLKPMYY